MIYLKVIRKENGFNEQTCRFIVRNNFLSSIGINLELKFLTVLRKNELSFKNEFENENELAKNRYLSKRIESTLIVNQFRVNPWKIRCGSLHRDEDSLVLFHTGEYNTFATYLFRR